MVQVPYSDQQAKLLEFSEHVADSVNRLGLGESTTHRFQTDFDVILEPGLAERHTTNQYPESKACSTMRSCFSFSPSPFWLSRLRRGDDHEYPFDTRDSG